MDNNVAITGNLTRDPELRFLPSGMAVAQLGVAVNSRKKVAGSDNYEDITSFFDVSVFGSLGENVSETLSRGARVVVVGRLEQRSWETTEGDKRSKVEIIADAVGPDLRWATAAVTRTEKKDAPANGRSARPQSRPAARAAAPADTYADEQY